MVTITQYGYRLDKVLAKVFDISISEAGRMIQQGAVEINGTRVPKDTRIITWPELWEIE